MSSSTGDHDEMDNASAQESDALRTILQLLREESENDHDHEYHGYTTIEVDVDDADNDEDEEDEDEDDEEDDEEEYEDAEDGEEEEEDDDDDDGDTHFEEIEVEVGNAGAAEDDETPARGNTDQRVRILRLLASSQLGRLFMTSVDDDDENGYFLRRRRRRPRPDPDRFPKVPSEAGIQLMSSGGFGANDYGHSLLRHKKKVARRIFDRELGINAGSKRTSQQLISQSMLPGSKADMVVHYDMPVYSGQFSDDGNFFYSCVKDFKVRMYDTSNPYRWRYYKTVDYPFGAWTLTDATLTPDNKYLAYTSIQPKVCLAPTDPNDTGDPYTLDLSDNGTRRRQFDPHGRRGAFGIWSLRFSGDGRELVAGTSNHSIVVYDIEARRSILEIPGHDDDVNAVCFGDKSSPHILYSGSDDTTLKVWDRRSMGDSREAGAFVGHTEGLTYIDSKGDGRYILSNAKDQSMKLWDLRMVMSTAKFMEIDNSRFTTNFDYRWAEYDEDEYQPHPHDNSLVTFRGHKVLRTLIRCHFSPPGSTNSRYVYTASSDGKVYVYNLDATIAAKIDVFAATKHAKVFGSNGRRRRNQDMWSQGSDWGTCVRDASWHPYAPIIAASAWNGNDYASGTVTTHSWNDGADDDEGEPAMGVCVDDRLS